MFQSKERRRERLRETLLPETWKRLLHDTVPLYGKLPIEDREELHGHIHVLLSEKHFEGAGGIEVTEGMKLIICAHAGLLLLHRETDYFPELITILIYPAAYQAKTRTQISHGVFSEVVETRAGESWTSGTLILAWEDVQRDLASRPATRSVVLHEFAHQLDAGSGTMNGAPILSDRELRQHWPEALSDAYDRLSQATRKHEPALLRPYGAKNPPEFFAVATEAFFLYPVQLQRGEADLYSALCQYFKQDPASW
ncbi:zinc-dependent peptidase [Candidatus Bipolaricaulota bacterium]